MVINDGSNDGLWSLMYGSNDGLWSLMMVVMMVCGH